MEDNRDISSQFIQSEAPQATKRGGFYDEAISISLTAQNGADIYYTTDGSYPTYDSTPYVEPISINKTTVLRAMSVKDGTFPSERITHTYTINEVATFKSEIIVRTITNIKNIEDVNALVKGCVENNISSISIACKQDEDDEVSSGVVFYPSLIAPVAEGYEKVDLLKYLIEIAHKNKIKVKAWIPQFHDQIAFHKNPSWRMMMYENDKVIPFKKNSEYFVNPLHPDVQAYELSIIKEIVSNYDFDSVVLDWIRFDGYNMDLSDFTREAYKKRFGYDPITIDFSKENPKRSEWNSYRTDGIALYVKRVRSAISKIKPDLLLGVYILSPEWEEVGQDPSKFKEYIDFVSPMAYYDDWDYPVDWIYGKRDDAILPLTRKKVGNKIIIPAFDTDWKKDIYIKIFANLHDIETLTWFEYGKWTDKILKRVGSF